MHRMLDNQMYLLKEDNGEAMRIEKEDVQLDQHCMSAIGTRDDYGEVGRRREDHGMMFVVFSLSTMVMGGSRLSDGTGVVPLTVDDLPRSAWRI